MTIDTAPPCVKCVHFYTIDAFETCDGYYCRLAESVLEPDKVLGYSPRVSARQYRSESCMGKYFSHKPPQNGLMQRIRLILGSIATID